ncbi:hypothetical protein ETAC_01220 [Edwardsiella piscicida C07-087]|nr:hypothetical protein ETAC_01220 [Edwardsiella piscicida C07-087]
MFGPFHDEVPRCEPSKSRARLSQIADSIGESWLHLKRAGAAAAGFTYAEAGMCRSSLFHPVAVRRRRRAAARRRRAYRRSPARRRPACRFGFRRRG